MAEAALGRQCRRVAATLLLATAAAAVELPGVPGPPLLGPERLGLRWGNDGFGPGGGAVSDDFRTNAVSVTWDGGPWFVSADWSMLTSKNPHGNPMIWDTVDGGSLVNEDKSRRDELTLAAGLRLRRDAGWATGWAQGGAGAVWGGDLGGASLQNHAHVVIGDDESGLPYETDGRRIEPMLHAGTGAGLAIAGPLRLEAAAVGTAQGGGFARWRAEADLVAVGPGGGLWLGWRWTDWAGDAPSLVARAVAERERGSAATAGIGFDTGGLRWTVQAERNLRNDAQYGVIGIGWVPDRLPDAPEAESWSGRFAVVGPDSLCEGRGYDFTAMRNWPVMLRPSLRVGYRDMHLGQPYVLDFDSRRLGLWAGPGLRPELLRAGPLRLFADLEAGAGVRRSQALASGFKTVGDDGGQRVDHTVAFARAAAGGGVAWVPERGPAIGLEVLYEVTAAPERSETVRIHSSTDGSVIDSKVFVMDGPSEGALAAIVVDWNW